MALRTEGCRKTRGDVIRHGTAKGRRAVPGRLVAAVAIGIRSGEAVVVVDVAVGAGIHFARWRELMRTKQRPARSGVIKHHVCPQRRAMAVRAIGCRKRSARSGVRRIIRLLPGRQVALRVAAIRRRDLQIVVVVDMAVRASIHLARGSQLVRTRQREPGGAVIKIGRLPGNRVVTTGASRHGKNRRRPGMFGIRGLLPGGQMALRIAAIGGRDGQVIVAVDVARSARNVGVAVCKEEARRAVIEFCSQPAIKGVAAVTGLGKLRRNVVRVSGFLKIPQVA